ncbi:MAG: proteasome subunit alpha [Chthoniobacterales bacterium]
MIEEPYRWVEAIANRREYIETQLSAGSPIAAVGYRDGIVFVTGGRTKQKVFEIYDRIAMGAIGHPGDIERLRMAAIELASAEGFTRSAADVSLRRLAHYSLSPLLKTAFEQIYGPPYLARMLFAEIGETQDMDLFLRVEYDGGIALYDGAATKKPHHFGTLSGTRESTEIMGTYLDREHTAGATFDRAFKLALNAWTIGDLALGESGIKELPARDKLIDARKSKMGARGVETAVLERDIKTAIRYRSLSDAEIEAALDE